MNECYFVEVLFLPDRRASGFARAMFHGTARRTGAKYPRKAYTPRDKLRFPLQVQKNVWPLAGVYQPSTNWIVSDAVKKLLPEGRNLKFLEVEYCKLFCYKFPMKKEKWSRLSADEQHEKFTHDEELRGEMGRWYELIVPPLGLLKEPSESAQTVSVELTNRSRPLQVKLVPEMFDEAPIFNYGGHFVRSDMFSELKPFIDERFFRITKVQAA